MFSYCYWRCLFNELNEMNYCNDLKYDLKVGNLAEKNLNKLLSGKNIEVKLDRWTQVTGNIAVEYMNRGKLSGISTSKADFWCFVIEIKGSQDLMVMVETNKLREVARRYYDVGMTKRIGDNNMSDAVLIPLSELHSSLNKIS